VIRARKLVGGIGALRRRLRASRRVGELELAGRACTDILETMPDDRRAVAVQAWIAERRGDSQGVDRHLGELEERAAAKGFLKDRNRLALRRATFRDNLGQPSRPHFERALELATATRDALVIYRARKALLDIAVRCGEITEVSGALEALLPTAADAGALAEALAAVSALASTKTPAGVPAARLLANRALANGEELVAAGWFRELLGRLPYDVTATRALEQLAIARGSWEELADLYALQAQKSEGAERAERLARLAELLEDELNRPTEAVRAWGLASLAGLGMDALREQLRVYREIGDTLSARRTLEKAIERAGASGEALAETLLLRGRFRRNQGDRPGALEDLERALKVSPGSMEAMRERAELKAETGDVSGARALELALERPGLAPVERENGYRCLAKLYEGALKRPADAQRAWEHLRREDPEGREPVTEDRTEV
jgi:tetratricopeptide (TPR) repeat protein